MLFPIDIAFISSSLEIVDIALNVQPGCLVTAEASARYFLEVNAGELDSVSSGDIISIQVVSPDTQPGWTSNLISFGAAAMTLGFAGAVIGMMMSNPGNPDEKELSEQKKYGISRARQLQTVFITKEAQQAMLELVKHARGKKVEYQLQLLLKDNKIYPGQWKHGAPDHLLALPGFGIFHTHPERPERLGQRLSDIDIIHLLVGSHKIIGVSTSTVYLVRTAPPYDVIETVDVQFAALIKEYPEEEKSRLIRLIPLVATTGAPVKGLEEFYRIYEFSLGPIAVPIEVLAVGNPGGFSSHGSPSMYWKCVKCGQVHSDEYVLWYDAVCSKCKGELVAEYKNLRC